MNLNTYVTVEEPHPITNKVLRVYTRLVTVKVNTSLTIIPEDIIYVNLQTRDLLSTVSNLFHIYL